MAKEMLCSVILVLPAQRKPPSGWHQLVFSRSLVVADLERNNLEGCQGQQLRLFGLLDQVVPVSMVPDEASPCFSGGRAESEKWTKKGSLGAACDGSVLQSKQIARFGYRIGWLRSQLVIQSKHAIKVQGWIGGATNYAQMILAMV